MNALRGTNLTGTSFPASGNIVVNFKSVKDRDSAAEKIKNEVANSTAQKAFTKLPKIMICNVNKELAEGQIVEDLIENNPYLASVDDIGNKIKRIVSRPAAGATNHHILKCEDPMIRKLIHEKGGDKVKLTWGVFDVRDRYHVIWCYHCQRYGHIAKECRFKEGSPSCGICSEDHQTRDCPSKDDPTKHKCITCVRKKKEDCAHKAHSRGCVPYTNKLREIESMTDHGF